MRIEDGKTPPSPGNYIPPGNERTEGKKETEKAEDNLTDSVKFTSVILEDGTQLYRWEILDTETQSTQVFTLSIPNRDNPQAPVPTQLTKNEEKDFKNFQKENSWFNPSFVNALAIAMFELAKTMSNMKLDDAQMKIMYSQKIFEVGMDIAELNRQLKYVEGQKEVVRAVTSFAQAAVSLGQLYGLLQAQGAARRETNATWEKRINDQTKVMNDTLGLGVTETGAAKIPTQAELDTALKDPTVKAQYDREKAKLQELEDQKERSFNTNMERERMKAQYIGEFVKNSVEGISALLGSELSFKSGDIEKLKGMAEALLQSMNKTEESLKNDFANQFIKFLEWIAQMISESAKAFTISQRG